MPLDEPPGAGCLSALVFGTGLTGSQPLGEIGNDERGRWESVMLQYRAYLLGRDGEIVKATEFVCADDAEAVIEATRLVDGHDVELWSGKRLVTRLKARTQ